ncbi:hypothetical protein RI844_07200 [Thalassotalea fonticola]|uniref:Uncharacterized protein n=1 Tax=Thalassotalea fonticola TaxID=3065649 RepID=A0ABZ0GT61_9GAMM|nr:hypothetical protein RI844_07200 [Colwelliaceae bacterium S1-1]
MNLLKKLICGSALVLAGVTSFSTLAALTIDKQSLVFGYTELNTESEEQMLTITSLAAETLTLTVTHYNPAGLVGGFEVVPEDDVLNPAFCDNLDVGTNATLTADTCILKIRHKPSQDGSQSALYTVTDGTDSVAFFVSNYKVDSANDKAKTNLAPTVEGARIFNGLTEVTAGPLDTGVEYTLKVNLVGYEKFRLLPNIYNCIFDDGETIAEATDCAKNTNTPDAASGTEIGGVAWNQTNFGTTLSGAALDNWVKLKYQGEYASHQEFSFTFTIPAYDDADVHDVVVRFYSRSQSNLDLRNYNSVTAMLASGLDLLGAGSAGYYGTNGRRLKLTAQNP